MPHQFSENSRINGLIESILDELCPFLEEQAKEISDLTAIGKALGKGKDISNLLEMILSIARRFTRADGGTLYLVSSDSKALNFHVLHNESLDIKQSGQSIDLPSVGLYHDDGSLNLSHVSAYVLHTGENVNIEDVYATDRFTFDGTKEFDRTLSYRSKSMLVIPMRNHEDEIIGILQLINAIDPSTQAIIPFSKDAMEKADALASQASVILTQQMLILEMKELFEAFIRAIAVSIDEKSKHTGGHIQRVTELCIMLAEQVNTNKTVYKNTDLTDDQLDELRIASLMHDTGKITTPDHIINKSHRLETVFDRIELIKTRLELFKTQAKLIAAEKKLGMVEQTLNKEAAVNIDKDCRQKLSNLDQEYVLIKEMNSCKTRLTDNQLNEIEELKNKFFTVGDNKMPYLTSDEYENLTIESGTLTPVERQIINNHADLSEKILNKLPWPKKLSNIPSIAGAHHEKLDGTGYPLQLDGSHLNIQARILAIADVFEALSAQDRPYKKAMKLSMTKQILQEMGQNGHLDEDLIDLLFESGIHLKYAKKHLSPSQVDL